MALKDWVPQVRKALDQALTDHIALTQGKLSQANPKDTGRMASSWFVGKDQPDLLTQALAMDNLLFRLSGSLNYLLSVISLFQFKKIIDGDIAKCYAGISKAK